MQISLVIVEGQPNGKSYPLTGDAIAGRLPAVPIFLDDQRASRKHARFLLRDGKPLVEDLGSVNGVVLNGKKIAGTAAIFHGDKIRIGDTVLRVEAPELRRPDGKGTSRTTRAAAVPKSPPPAPPKGNGASGGNDADADLAAMDTQKVSPQTVSALERESKADAPVGVVAGGGDLDDVEELVLTSSQSGASRPESKPAPRPGGMPTPPSPRTAPTDNDSFEIVAGRPILRSRNSATNARRGLLADTFLGQDFGAQDWKIKAALMAGMLVFAALMFLIGWAMFGGFGDDYLPAPDPDPHPRQPVEPTAE